MRKLKLKSALLVLLGSLAGNNAIATEQNDIGNLVAKYGCDTCHSLRPVETKSASSALPVGPSFFEISARFHSDKGSSYADLARIIKHGSSPYRSQWKGKISGLAMPPNDKNISDLEINRLLVWILTLKEPSE